MESQELLGNTQAVMYTIVSIISTIGSILIMVTILTSERLRNHHKNGVLFGMLMAGLVMGVFAMPVSAVLAFTQDPSRFGCSLALVVLGYSRCCFPFITLWGLVILTLDRLIRQTCSLKSESSPVMGILLALLQWIGMSIFVIIIIGTFNIGSHNCYYMFEPLLLLALATVSCFIPSAILLISIPLMIMSRRKLARSDKPDEKTLMTPQCTSIYPITAASVVSVLLLAPLQILQHLFSDDPAVWFILTCLAMCTPSVFPWLWIADPDIWRELKSTLCFQKVSPTQISSTVHFSKCSVYSLTDEVKLR